MYRDQTRKQQLQPWKQLTQGNNFSHPWEFFWLLCSSRLFHLLTGQYFLKNSFLNSNPKQNQVSCLLSCLFPWDVKTFVHFPSPKFPSWNSSEKKHATSILSAWLPTCFICMGMRFYATPFWYRVSHRNCFPKFQKANYPYPIFFIYLIDSQYIQLTCSIRRIKENGFTDVRAQHNDKTKLALLLHREWGKKQGDSYFE